MILIFLIVLLSIILFIMNTFIFIFLLIRKYINNILERKKESYRILILPLITRYITHDEEKLSRMLFSSTNWKRKVILNVLYDISKKVTSASENNRIQNLCHILGYTKELEKNLKHKKRWIASDALQKAGVLKLNELAPVIKNILYSNDNNLWLLSARSLTNMNESKDLIYFLIEKGHVIPSWSAIRIGEMLLRVNSHDTDTIIKYFFKASPLVQRVFIDVLGSQRTLKALPLIEHCLYAKDGELRIKALKAIGDIGITTKEYELILFLQKNHWVEQIAAIYAIKSCRIWMAIPQLKKLLSHENWWVRLRAAQALKSFGEKGKRELELVKINDLDPFARDMATKVLEND